MLRFLRTTASRRLAVLSLMVVLLAACGSAAPPQYRFIPPSTLSSRACSIQCEQAHSYCQSGCSLDQRACVTGLETLAMHDYEAYIQNQIKRHQPADLRVRDFERTNTCDANKQSCEEGCGERFRACYEQCGGKVIEASSCHFLCF